MSGTPRGLLAAALLLLSCKAEVAQQAAPPALAPESPAPTRVNEPLLARAGAAGGAPDPHLPIVGDPLGLLSRAPASAPEAPLNPARDPRSFDPGALMKSAADAPESKVELERDPRAVARGQAALEETPKTRAIETPRSAASLPIQEKSAAEVFGAIRRGASRPHVLFLYAAYCPGCRKVMPQFLPLVQHYKPRGVQFTAASIDRDATMYGSYAPVLGGVLPPVLIRSEGVTAIEMRRAGLTLPGDSFSIPLVALFDKTRRIVMQGGSAAMAKLPQQLDELL